MYKEAKREALSVFQKKAVGNVAEEFIKELKHKMKTLYIQLKEENERESTH